MSYSKIFCTFVLLSYALFAAGIATESITVRHTEGKGLGYSQGYSTLALFLSQPLCNEQLVPFAELRGHIFNNGRRAANAGLGLRWLNPCYDQVWGVNMFYDYRHTTQQPYEQLSFGLEFLDEVCEFHLNGYLPIGSASTPLYDFALAPLGFQVIAKQDLAMKGIDSEFGYHFCYGPFDDLYVAAGPYLYWGTVKSVQNLFRTGHEHAFGARVRAFASFYDYFTLDATTAYDNTFNWTGQITLGVTIPFDFTFNTCCEDPCCFDRRFYQPVVRNEIIVVDRVQRYSSDINVLDPEFEP